MFSSNPLAEILRGLLTQAPMLLLCFSGLVIALVRWRSFPKPSLFAALGLFLIMLMGVLGPVARWFISHRITENTGHWHQMFGVLEVVMWSVAMICLIVGVFADRRPVQSVAASAEGEKAS